MLPPAMPNRSELDSAAHVPMANQHTDLCNRDVNDLPTVQSNRAPQPIVSLDLRSFGTGVPFRFPATYQVVYSDGVMHRADLSITGMRGAICFSVTSQLRFAPEP